MQRVEILWHMVLLGKLDLRLLTRRTLSPLYFSLHRDVFLERNHFKIDKFEIKVPKYCRFHNAMIAIVQNVSNMLRSYGTWFSPGNWISDFLLAERLVLYVFHCTVTFFAGKNHLTMEISKTEKSKY